MAEENDKPDATEDVESPEDVDTTDEPTGASKDEPEFDEARAKAKIAKANQEAKNLRQRLKELEPLAAKAKELEDANKSETEKLSEDRDGHKSRADTAETALLKLRVALDNAPEGASLAHVKAVAKRLSGANEDELAEDAAELYELVGANKARVQRRPTEKMRGGNDPDEPVEETDPRKLAALIQSR